LSTKNWVKFIFLGLVCGSTFLWIKLALREVNPFMLVFFRVFFASIGLGVYFLFIRRKLNLRWWWVYAFIGFFNVAFPFVLISWAENHISSGLASILNSTVPIFTMVIASIFYKQDKFTLRHGIALLFGFMGVLTLSYTKLEGNSDFQILGILAMLLAACSYSASTVFARRADQFVSPEDHSIGQVVAALVFMTPAMFITNSSVNLPSSPITWIAFLWLGLIVSFVAAVFWFRLIYEIGPSRASMISYIFPLVGVVLGIIFLGEKINWQVLVGGLLILVGIYIVNSKRVSQRVKSRAGDTSPGTIRE
jgi:drug/metabolite transporter (DMT)-like permease